ncbi:TfuA-like protein [Streptomyces sp. NPDC055897]
MHEMLSGCSVHPPARHGDFISGKFTESDIIVLVDGLYHGTPPIRHKEILDTIAGGSTVIGAASMGALRAAELHSFGMVGIGQIFEDIRDGLIESDDEVAVLHTDGPQWQILSEALVNMRYTLTKARQASVITPSEEAQLLQAARALHYPRRSWKAVELSCKGDAALADAARRTLVFARDSGHSLNLKRRDALAALRHAQTLAESGTLPRQEAPSDWPTGWRTNHLRQWRLDYTGVHVDGHFVSRASQFDYQRLFGHDQVQRWRRYVLSVITGLPPDSSLTDLEDQALTTASKEHVTWDSIPAAGAEYWLTDSELRALPPRQLLLTVLIRSSRPAADLNDEQVTRWLLPQQTNTAELVSSSLDINERVLRTSFSKHTDHLKTGVLEQHLGLLWNLGKTAGRRDRNAAARDRGFASASEAAQALRPFFLKDHNDRKRKGA